MGRFENRPENPRARGEISRAAETALWGVVEDLQSLQQNVLKSLQEDINRLESEKSRLANDIKRLQSEKEQLQQTRQITEQQALMRQLAQVLANHISSQLQSSLSDLANQAMERDINQGSAIASNEANTNLVTEINKNTEQLLGTLDDTLTITLKLLQQEMNNYQSGISQQVSRMHSQQQQAEVMLTELINRFSKELEKITKATPQVAAQSLDAPKEQKQESVKGTSPEMGEVNKNTVAPISVIPSTQSKNKTILSASPVSAANPHNEPKSPEAKKNPTLEPISVTPNTQSKNGTTSTQSALSAANPHNEPKSPEVKKNSTLEPISVTPKEQSNSEATLTQSALSAPNSHNNQPKSPEVKKDPKEPISVLSRDEGETRFPPQRQRASRGAGALSPMQMGLLLIGLSTVLSSLYKVAIKAIFQPNAQILGAFQVEGLISPTLGNSLLILMLRMMVVVPLMLVLAPMMHQRVWQDLQNLADSVRGNPSPTKANTKRVLVLSIVSGCFLFLSQVLIYLAIGQVPTGMAIALFFIYPMISGLLSWFLFRDQPTLFGASALASIFLGELLLLSGSTITGIGNNSLGSTTAIASGVSFAIYVILTRICAAKLHPVTFTLINFATMLFLCFIGLMLPLPSSWSLVIDPNKLLELILSAFILGVMTLLAYVLNNVGIGKLGATRGAIVGASVPVLTVIFAGLIIQEPLQIVQILGILLVTFGAGAISLEKMRSGRLN